MTPDPVGTLCASQTNTLSPCSAVPFLSHRQTPHPHTASYTHRHPHMHPHTHTHTHTHTSTEPTGAQTQETWGPRGSAHTSGLWSMWEQPRVPAEGSHWTFRTLGATGTLRNSLRTRETVEGLRLTQLGPDQTSLFCKICSNDQWTPHRRGTGIHSRCGSFLVKNTDALLQNSRHLSLHQGIHSLLWTQDRGAALTLTTHHGAEEEDTESPQGEVSAQSHLDFTSSRSQSQLQDQPVRRRQGADRGLYRPPLTPSLLGANSNTFYHFRHYRRLHLPLSAAQTPMNFCIFNISLYEQHGPSTSCFRGPESRAP